MSRDFVIILCVILVCGTYVFSQGTKDRFKVYADSADTFLLDSSTGNTWMLYRCNSESTAQCWAPVMNAQ